jgi:AcrR family transcriptional regulator
MTPAEAALRPRVEGDREQEILDAALEVLGEVGYDRLTMDAVAHRAKASKATLYRRWNSKATLVVEALASQKTTPPVPDTGDLRTDLLTAFCGMGGLTDHDTTVTLGAVITAVSTDPEFASVVLHRVFIFGEQPDAALIERAIDQIILPAVRPTQA